MATYFKGSRDYIGQNLNEKWTDLVKNEDFKEALLSIAGIQYLETTLASRTHADNAAALAAGLEEGQLYINSTSDTVSVVVTP